jgi:phosphoribosylaminoimidazole-succinocarboxamide synthase
MIDETQILYSGKAKSLYKSGSLDELICVFRDDTSAFNGVKLAKLNNKGKVNNQFNAFIMQKLHQAGIKTHFIELIDDITCKVQSLDMIKVECVIRNFAAGSLCKRLAISEGSSLCPPVFEFFLKDDQLGDPFINESHILTFNWATESEIKQMKHVTHQVNNILVDLFKQSGMLLVDYKLEFGRNKTGEIILGDELTPDGCRIWDESTKKIMDKDRFRKDLGNVVETYQEVFNRLNASALV